MNRHLPSIVAAFCAINLPLLATAHVGKLLISAQFTHGFLIGVSVTLDVFFVAWIVTQSKQVGTRLPNSR